MTEQDLQHILNQAHKAAYDVLSNPTVSRKVALEISHTVGLFDNRPESE